MQSETRPWGEFHILENSEFYKVKRIVVKTNQRLSYQSHSQRKEFWTVIKGYAKVVLDGEERLLTVGDSIEIPLGAKHRVQNASEFHDLEFIEVQTGTYFGEDDIVRYSDDYGRVE